MPCFKRNYHFNGQLSLLPLQQWWLILCGSFSWDCEGKKVVVGHVSYFLFDLANLKLSQKNLKNKNSIHVPWVCGTPPSYDSDMTKSKMPLHVILFWDFNDKHILLHNTANKSDSNESQIPHFSKFYSRLLKLSIQEKIPDRPLEKPLKLIRDISE